MSEVSAEVVAKLAQIAGVGLRLLAARLIAILSLLMSFGLFCYAISDHSWVAYVTATTFALVIFIPALWNSRSKDTPHA